MNLLFTVITAGLLVVFPANDYQKNQLDHQTIQEDQSHREMIVSFENLHPKNEPNLVQQFTGLEGIDYVGRCPEINVFFFQYNPEKYSTAEQAFDVLTLATKDYQPLLKIGSSIAQVQGACLK